MKKHLGLLAAIGTICTPLLLGACDKIFPPKQVEEPVEEAPKPTSMLDMDKAATDAFRNDIKARFPSNRPTREIEDYFKSIGFECSSDPTSPTDRACTKIDNKTSTSCTIMTIIRTQPFTPDGAQVIRGCKTSPDSQIPESSSYESSAPESQNLNTITSN